MRHERDASQVGNTDLGRGLRGTSMRRLRIVPNMHTLRNDVQYEVRCTIRNGGESFDLFTLLSSTAE